MDGKTLELEHYTFQIRIPIPPRLIPVPANEPEHFGWTKQHYAIYEEFENGKYALTYSGY